MTLEQSDFQQLTEVLVRLIERYRGNPVLVEIILSEFHDMYRKIPIYPGIVSMCLEKIVQKTDVKEIRPEEEVVLKTRDGKTIAGKVAEIGDDEIALGEVQEVVVVPVPEKVRVKKSDIVGIERINREILRKEWPSLDFEVE